MWITYYAGLAGIVPLVVVLMSQTLLAGTAPGQSLTSSDSIVAASGRTSPTVKSPASRPPAMQNPTARREFATAKAVLYATMGKCATCKARGDYRFCQECGGSGLGVTSSHEQFLAAYCEYRRVLAGLTDAIEADSFLASQAEKVEGALAKVLGGVHLRFALTDDAIDIMLGRKGNPTGKLVAFHGKVITSQTVEEQKIVQVMFRDFYDKRPTSCFVLVPDGKFWPTDSWQFIAGTIVGSTEYKTVVGGSKDAVIVKPF